MRIDIVRCGRGWYAFYVDGFLTEYINSDPLETLSEQLDGGHYVDTLAVVSLGKCGREALRDCQDDLPDEINDIPLRWWSDGSYEVNHE